jgi:hypothetical protein
MTSREHNIPVRRYVLLWVGFCSTIPALLCAGQCQVSGKGEFER